MNDLKIDLKKQKFKWAKGDNLNWYRVLTLNKMCFEEAIGVRFKNTIRLKLIFQ